MQRIHELLIGMAQGSRNSLYGMFGSSTSFDDHDNDNDDLPPAYLQNSNPNSDFISQDRFRPAASMRWQLVPQDEPSTLRVTAAEFLWRMSKVTADVHPWDNKIRSSTRYRDGTCDKALYNIVCHLMAIAETRAKWSTISIASWLTAGARYLSWVCISCCDLQVYSTNAYKTFYAGTLPVVIRKTKQNAGIRNGNICRFCQSILGCPHY